MSQNKKTFTLDDLELDQVVETRDGYWFIVCKTKEDVVLSGEHGWISLYDVYTDDLTNMDGDYEDDIMKVWDITNNGKYAHAVSPENRELLWEREEKEEPDWENEVDEALDELMTSIGKACGLSDEEIEKAKEDAYKAAEERNKKSAEEINEDFERTLTELEHILKLAALTNKLFS